MATGLDTARLEAQLANEQQQLTAGRYEVERLQVHLLHALGITRDVRLVLTESLKTQSGDIPAMPEALSALSIALAETGDASPNAADQDSHVRGERRGQRAYPLARGTRGLWIDRQSHDQYPGYIQRGSVSVRTSL